MPCPGCRDENPQHAKFCLECGRPSKGTDKSGPPVLSYADLQHALSEALGQIQTRDRELVEAQEQQTALGAVSGTPAAFPTAPWYRALAFAIVAGYTPGVPGGAPYPLPFGW